MEIVETLLTALKNAAIVSDDDEQTHEDCVGEASARTFLGKQTGSYAQANLLTEGGTSNLRMDRIKAIQSGLADGTYNVSASEVGAKLIIGLLRA